MLRGRVTTCVAPREDWFLRAEKIDIDTAKKVGVAHDARLDFMGVPILYSPWLEFPLSNDRKSGFLTPTFGSSGERGIDFALPYYFNLAPNYDATVTPRIMTKRGVQVGAEFRYLFSDVSMPNQGQAYVEVLPDDRQTDTTRWLYSWRHNQQITPWLAGYFNLNKVSDDKYFADLSERVAITSQSTLAREGGLAATFGPLSVLARAEKFQTLQDPNAPIMPPYDRVPQILGTLSEVEWRGLAFSGIGEYARFRRPRLRGRRRRSRGALSAGRMAAQRVVLVVRRARQRPRAAVRSADAAGSTATARRDVVVPIASLDGGLVFERPWSAFGDRTSSRRSSRARSTSTSRIATRTSCRCSTRRSTTSTSRSCSPRTATSATTASATRTSSRSR